MSRSDLVATRPGPSNSDPGTTRQARRLVVAWQHPTQRLIQPIGWLTFTGTDYTFEYVRNALSVDDFRPLIGFPDLQQRYQSPALFPLFAQRAMDPRRADYSRYVQRLGLDDDTTPWEQIARSGGRREGDALQLFPEPTLHEGRVSCAFLVHGIRWIDARPMRINGTVVQADRDSVEGALTGLRPGDTLLLGAEPDNPKNPLALVVSTTDGIPLGWVPDLLVEDLARLREVAELSVSAEVINRPDAPAHLRLMARLESSSAPNFQFFSSSRWQPVSA